MHRLILTSAAYRRSSLHPAPQSGQLKDPQNALLWRFQPQRLESEQIRDAIFTACGDLKTEKQAGPSVVYGEPVRSIFTRIMRNNRDPLADVFEWARPQNLPVVVVPGADHFFHRRLMDLRGAVKNGVRKNLPPPRHG